MRTRIFLLIAIMSLGCSSEAEAPPAATDGSVDDTATSSDSVVAETGGDASIDDTTADAIASDGGADAPDVAADVASDGEPACNSLALFGTDVMGTQIATAAPTLAGGTLVDGTYALSAFVEYTGTGGASGATLGPFGSTMSLTAGSYAVRWVEPTDTSTSKGTLTHDASSITLVETCPGTDTVVMAFEAKGTSLKVSRATAGGGAIELTYERK